MFLSRMKFIYEGWIVYIAFVSFMYVTTCLSIDYCLVLLSQLLKKKMCGLIFDVCLIKLHCRRGISSRIEQTLKFRRLPSANFKLE